MKGWYNERHRHSLAAKGIKTSLFAKRNSFQAVDEERLRLINMALLTNPEREDELVSEGLRAEESLIYRMEDDLTHWVPEIMKGDFVLEMKNGDYFVFKMVGMVPQGPVWVSNMPGFEEVPIFFPELQGLIQSLYPLGIHEIKGVEMRAGFAGKEEEDEKIPLKGFFSYTQQNMGKKEEEEDEEKDRDFEAIRLRMFRDSMEKRRDEDIKSGKYFRDIEESDPFSDASRRRDILNEIDIQKIERISEKQREIFQELDKRLARLGEFKDPDEKMGVMSKLIKDIQHEKGYDDLDDEMKLMSKRVFGERGLI